MRNMPFIRNIHLLRAICSNCIPMAMCVCGGGGSEGHSHLYKLSKLQCLRYILFKQKLPLGSYSFPKVFLCRGNSH